MEHYGIVPASSTIYIPFTTHDKDGGAVAPSSAFEAADVRIYKNGSNTQRASEAGYTMTSPFDSITGLHLLAVDLSDNTDSGFYAAGSRYFVLLAPNDETIDSETPLRVLAEFEIGPPAVNVSQWLGTAAATPTVAGVPEVDLTHVGGSTTNVAALATNVDAILTDTGTTLQAELDGIQADTEDIQSKIGTPAGASVSADIAAVKAETAAIVNDTDVIDDATSGLVKIAQDVAAILVDTGTTLQAELDGIQADTEDIQSKIGSPAGASVSADIAAVKSETASILDDTDLIDDATSGLAKIATDVAAVLVDTAVIGAAGAGLTAVPWNASWDAEVQSEVQDALDATIADSIPSDGTRPSISSALLMLTRFMFERSVTSTTVTVTKEDGSTSNFTLTLDDATSPTSITRAT